MVPDLVIPWAAPGANADGLHIEICGFAKWTREEWLAHERMLERAAYKVARWCRRFDIAARWLTDKQLANRASHGLTTHAQVSRVFKRSDHTDPGPNFPKDVFLAHVRGFLAELVAEEL